MEVEFYLLGQSHGVALLDAITDWRQHLGPSLAQDSRYGEAFQGWFHGRYPSLPFEACVTKGTAAPGRLVAWLISAGEGIGPLVSVDRDAGGSVVRLQVNPRYAELLGSWSGATPIVSMIGGNKHATMMFNCWPPYDFFDDTVADIDKGACIVDGTFIDKVVESWVNESAYPLEALRGLVPNPLVHVLPPPPRENPGNCEYREIFGEAMARYGFVSDHLRLKWYYQYCRALTSRLSTIGCKAMPAPPQACTSQGLLRERYAEGLTHGNSEYGLLLAGQIRSWIGVEE